MSELFATLKIKYGADVDKHILSLYVGELKREGGFSSLEFETFLVRDCDQNGSLLKLAAVNLVQVQAILVKNERAQVSYVLNCLKCNQESATVKQCLENRTEKQESISKSWDYCIHTAAVQKFGPKQHMENAEFRDSQTEVDVKILSENPHIAACYSKSKYGLVTCDFQRGGKRGHCFTCKSINCGHATLWNQVERPTRLLKPVKITGITSKEQVENSPKKKFQNSPLRKMPWPPGPEDVQTFKKLAEEGHQYRDMEEMIPKIGEKKKCACGFPWSQKCPKKQGWVDSTKIVLYHNDWVKPKQRIAYYREAEGCPIGCKLQFTGEDQFLLSMSSVYSKGKMFLRLIFNKTFIYFCDMSEIISNSFYPQVITCPPTT